MEIKPEKLRKRKRSRKRRVSEKALERVRKNEEAPVLQGEIVDDVPPEETFADGEFYGEHRFDNGIAAPSFVAVLDVLLGEFGLPFTASQLSRSGPNRRARAPVARPSFGSHRALKTDTGMKIEFALPGVSKKDIEVYIEDGQLCVKVESMSGGVVGGGFVTGRYHNSLPLPEGVGSKDVKVTYRNGVLKVAVESEELVRRFTKHHIEVE